MSDSSESSHKTDCRVDETVHEAGGRVGHRAEKRRLSAYFAVFRINLREALLGAFVVDECLDYLLIACHFLRKTYHVAAELRLLDVGIVRSLRDA